MRTNRGLIDTGDVLRPEDIAWERIATGLLAQHIASSMISGFSLGISSCHAALGSGSVYDQSICSRLKKGVYGEQLAMELMVEDVQHAADHLLPVFKRTKGVDGWALVPASPLLPAGTTAMVEAVLALDAEVQRPNVLISIPGLPYRLPAFEKLVTLGIPLHVGPVFSLDQFQAIALVYRNACEARLAEGSEPASTCFMTIEIDRLITGLHHFLPDESAVETGIAITAQIAQAAEALWLSESWQRLTRVGAQHPRLVWTLRENRTMSRMEITKSGRTANHYSIGAMTPKHGATLYGQTFSDEYQTARKSLHRLELTGITFTTFADRLQNEEAETTIRSWIGFLDSIARKSAALTTDKYH